MEARCMKRVEAVMNREVGQGMKREEEGGCVGGRKGRAIKERGVKLIGKAKKGRKEGGLKGMREGRGRHCRREGGREGGRENECDRTIFIDGLC